MKNYISLICPVYNSHKVFKEQILFQNKHYIDYKDNVEVIYVDDGSNPDLVTEFCHIKLNLDGFINFKILNTGVKIPWNQYAASNLGAKYAKGNYLLFYDIDHIIPKEAVEEILNFDGLRIQWDRISGVLRNGEICTDISILKEYGDVIYCKPVKVTNTYGIRKDIFLILGGYNENYCGYYNHKDGILHNEFRCKYGRPYRSKDVIIYVYPESANNSNLFHDLPRDTDNKNIKYKKE